MVIKVNIWGHSFIRRTKEHIDLCDTKDKNFGIHKDAIQINWNPISGGQLNDISVPAILNNKPHIVILDFGSNDLCSQNLSAMNWASQYDDMVNGIINDEHNPASVVVIMPIFYRKKRGVKNIPSEDGIRLYNLRVNDANRFLKVFASNRKNVIFWDHTRFRLRPTDVSLLSTDGIHLADALIGARYYHSLRSAVTCAEDVLRGRRKVENAGVVSMKYLTARNTPYECAPYQLHEEPHRHCEEK